MEIGDTCKRGHLVRGDNVQFYSLKGVQRVRCATCNTPPRHKAVQPGDTCKNGHLIKGENLGERQGKFFCVECRRNAGRKYFHSDKGQKAWRKHHDPAEHNKLNRERAAQRKAAERADSLITDGKDDQALNYLMLSKRADRANQALWEAYKSKKPLCNGRESEYIDYDEDKPPSKTEAYLMCEGCSVLIECARFAAAYKPPIGVWGGEVWSNGRVIN